jgi:hypothetical protein
MLVNLVKLNGEQVMLALLGKLWGIQWDLHLGELTASQKGCSRASGATL